MNQNDILEIIGWIVYGLCAFHVHSKYASDKKIKERHGIK